MYTNQPLGHSSRAVTVTNPPSPPPNKGLLSHQCCGYEQGSLEESLEAAGGVSSNIVEAFRAVLQDSSLDGAFVSAAITLPASTELRDDIPNLNPLLLYQVRWALRLGCLASRVATRAPHPNLLPCQQDSEVDAVTWATLQHQSQHV